MKEYNAFFCLNFCTIFFAFTSVLFNFLDFQTILEQTIIEVNIKLMIMLAFSPLAHRFMFWMFRIIPCFKEFFIATKSPYVFRRTGPPRLQESADSQIDSRLLRFQALYCVANNLQSYKCIQIPYSFPDAYRF